MAALIHSLITSVAVEGHGTILPLGQGEKPLPKCLVTHSSGELKPARAYCHILASWTGSMQRYGEGLLGVLSVADHPEHLTKGIALWPNV